MQAIPLPEWLDRNVPEWRTLDAHQLGEQMTVLWKHGAFMKLRGHTRNCGIEPVLVRGDYYSHVVPAPAGSIGCRVIEAELVPRQP